MKTVLIFGNNHRWGKGEYFVEAFNNACQSGDSPSEMSIYIFDCEPDEIKVDSMGGYKFPENSKVKSLKNIKTPKKILEIKDKIESLEGDLEEQLWLFEEVINSK